MFQKGLEPTILKFQWLVVFSHTVEFNFKNFALCPQNASLCPIWFLKYEIIIIIIIIIIILEF